MIADFKTMYKMFVECNKCYFNNSLPTPKFATFNKLNTIAKFVYNKNKGGKYPIKWQEIRMSNCYDYTEQDFREIMVHEMIHYYIALNGIKDNKEHGREFMRIADNFNSKYNLNITKTKNAFSLNKREKSTGIKKHICVNDIRDGSHTLIVFL